MDGGQPSVVSGLCLWSLAGGVWCVVCGLWLVVYVLRFVVGGLWSVVCGMWPVEYCSVAGVLWLVV